jgi:hypothetical protein
LWVRLLLRDLLRLFFAENTRQHEDQSQHEQWHEQHQRMVRNDGNGDRDAREHKCNREHHDARDESTGLTHERHDRQHCIYR